MKELDIEARIQQLEVSNKRLKFGLFSIVTLLFAGALLGATQSTAKVVTAESLVLVDDHGRQRAQLSSNGKSSALQFLNTDGSRALVVSAGEAGNGVIVNSVHGESRAIMTALSDESSLIALKRGKENRNRIALRDSLDGSVLFANDDNGKNRLSLGFADTIPSISLADEHETIMAAIAPEVVATFSKAGDLQWTSTTADLSAPEKKKVLDFINMQKHMK